MNDNTSYEMRKEAEERAYAQRSQERLERGEGSGALTGLAAAKRADEPGRAEEEGAIATGPQCLAVSPVEAPPIDLKLAAEIRAEQDHGRQKYGRGPDDLEHDDNTPESRWHDYIADHNIRASLTTPMERRQHLVKVAGLAISAIGAFDRRSRKASSPDSSH